MMLRERTAGHCLQVLQLLQRCAPWNLPPEAVRVVEEVYLQEFPNSRTVIDDGRYKKILTDGLNHPRGKR